MERFLKHLKGACRRTHEVADLEHFTVHDLRRICRTLIAEQGTPDYVAERCLNHKLKGVEGIYNKHDYFDERRETLSLLAGKVTSLQRIQKN